MCTCVQDPGQELYEESLWVPTSTPRSK
jgi:hypothetical protein